MDHLSFTPAAHATLLSHAREGRERTPPAEVCGVLGGRRGTNLVTEVHRVPNVAPRPRTTYELDPEATLAAIEGVEAACSELLGFYHSHPAGPAGPSETDRAAARWTGYVYCIVSFAGETPESALETGDARTGAWRWTGEEFETLAVTLKAD